MTITSILPSRPDASNPAYGHWDVFHPVLVAPSREIQWVRINWLHWIFPLFSVREESIAEIGRGSGADGYDAGLQEEEI